MPCKADCIHSSQSRGRGTGPTRPGIRDHDDTLPLRVCARRYVSGITLGLIERWRSSATSKPSPTPSRVRLAALRGRGGVGRYAQRLLDGLEILLREAVDVALEGELPVLA